MAGVRTFVLLLSGVLQSSALRRQSHEVGAKRQGWGRRRRPEDCNVSQLGTRIVSPGDGDYDEARAQFGSKMGSSSAGEQNTHPEVIAFCQKDADVIEVVAFAKQCGFKASVRSGGHQYAALSSCVAGTKCLQLDVSQLETFSASGSLVTLGVGLTVTQVVDRLTPLGLVIPMGVCKDVGVGGHFQSSALGFLARSFGSGMDHIMSFRIVTADGQIRSVDRSSDPDLYWAVLGGGPGSWGVVLDYTISAIPAVNHPNSHLIVKVFPYTHDLFVKMATAYLEIMSAPEVERDLEILLSISPIQGMPAKGNFNHYINFQALWTGIDNGRLTESLYARWLQPMLNFASPLPSPFPNVDTPMPLSAAVYALQTPFDYSPFRYHMHSMSAPGFFDSGFVEDVATEIDARVQMPGMFTVFQFQPYGGTGKGSQVNRNKGLNSFPQRDIGMHIDDWLYFLTDENADTAAMRMKAFRTNSQRLWRTPGSASSTWMSTGTIFPFNSSDGRRFEEYYPETTWFSQLQKIKARVDASDVFSTAMTIPPK